MNGTVLLFLVAVGLGLVVRTLIRDDGYSSTATVFVPVQSVDRGSNTGLALGLALILGIALIVWVGNSA
jgi:hypothetical protein